MNQTYLKSTDQLIAFKSTQSTGEFYINWASIHLLIRAWKDGHHRVLKYGTKSTEEWVHW